MKKKITEQFLIKVVTGNANESEIKKLYTLSRRSRKKIKDFEKYKKVWELTGKITEPEIDPDIHWTELASKVRKEKAYGIILWLKAHFRLYRIILVLILLALACVFILNNGLTDKKVSLVEITSGKGETQTVILPDSSIVTLNSFSKIYYPSRWNRLVHLEGEAYFQINSRMKYKTFRLVMGKYEVIVTGTKFNAKYRNQLAIIHVFEGSVLVINNLTNDIVKLDRGKVAYLSTSATDVEEFKTDNLYPSWLDGKITFFNTPILEVMKELQNYYEFNFVLVNPEKVINKRITGEFNRKLTLEKIMEAISFSTGLEIEIIPPYPGGNKIVKIK